MFLNSSSAERLEPVLEKGDFQRNEPKKNNLNYSINFANEDLPLHDPKVAARMKKTLNRFEYENLQTRVLHLKASKWFPIIEPILRRYNIPEDFKYIPLVESGLKSGTSHKGASGYWQFMPQTARTFGLKVEGDIDERQNVHKSTVAACKYLRALYNEFNNWTLVAAAYNIGENKLWSQIRRQKHRNYFRMKLNRETATYVYKLVSVKEIIEKPGKYGYLPPGKRRLLAKAEFINPEFRHSTILTLQQMQN
jgi:hypothetical protein